jgi:predicted MFS family arabinose efflux permease
LTPALTLILLAFSQSQRPGWDWQDVLAWSGAGLGGLVVFVLVERRQKTPLIELQLFRHRVFSAAAAVYFLNTFTGMGVSFAAIVFLQQALEYTPLQVGILLLPATVGRVAGELAGGHFAYRWGARGLSLVGLAIFACSCVMLGRLDRQSDALLIAVLLVLGTTGMALSNSPMIYSGLRTLRDERISMGSGVLSLVRIGGGTFGVGVVGPLVAMAERWARAQSGAGPAPPLAVVEPSLAGYQIYFSLMALLIVGTMLPAFLVRSDARHSDP